MVAMDLFPVLPFTDGGVGAMQLLAVLTFILGVLLVLLAAAAILVRRRVSGRTVRLVFGVIKLEIYDRGPSTCPWLAALWELDNQVKNLVPDGHGSTPKRRASQRRRRGRHRGNDIDTSPRGYRSER